MKTIKLNEEAKSESQRRLMGMALAYKRGDLVHASDKVKELANSMTEKQLEDYAKSRKKTKRTSENEHIVLSYNDFKKNLLNKKEK